MKIVIPAVILRNGPAARDLEAKLKALGAEVYSDEPSQEEFARRIADAEIITTRFSVGLTAEMIDAAPKLKYVIVPAVGYESFDIQHATEKGIKVMNCPKHNSQAVAEYAITLLLAASRKITQANSLLRDGEWEDEEFVGQEVTGKKLGLIGHGNIGTRIDKMATGIGMQVNFVDSKSSVEELESLLRESDYVCICAPLKQETRHLLNAERLNLLKPTSILINVARGGLIDQAALLEHLKAGKIAGAALDVFEGEPTSSGQPIRNEIAELAALPNVIAMPHIAYNTDEALDKLKDEVLANIESTLAGQPQNVVN